MAVAVVRLLLRVIPYLSKILRAQTFFRSVNSVRKLENAILKYDDLKDLIKRDKKVKDFILNQLFKLQLKSNNFIFFSEKELIEFIRSRDSDAKILKLLETREVSLYLVEGKVFSNKWQGFLNYFSFALLFSQFNNFETNTVLAITNTYNLLANKLEKMKNAIINKLEQEKQNDINNTYCLPCSCCCSCSCTKGSCSCCCSCDCSLVHYTQSWENLRSFILQEFSNYSTFLENTMLKDEKNSLKAQFILLFNALMQFLFLNIKEKYLFAVIKEKELLKEIKKEERKTNVSRIIYEFLMSKKGEKIEYNKFIEQLQKYLYNKLKKEYTRKQVITLYNTVKQRYHINVVKIKKDKKTFVVVV